MSGYYDSNLYDVWLREPEGTGQVELKLSEDELYNKVEVIANDFYEEYIQGSPHRLEIGVYETYTKEDFLKIEPEKSEQYYWKVKESTYENNSRFPVRYNSRVRVEIGNEGR